MLELWSAGQLLVAEGRTGGSARRSGPGRHCHGSPSRTQQDLLVLIPNSYASWVINVMLGDMGVCSASTQGGCLMMPAGRLYCRGPTNSDGLDCIAKL